jgi:hypothetical protein
MVNEHPPLISLVLIEGLVTKMVKKYPPPIVLVLVDALLTKMTTPKGLHMLPFVAWNIPNQHGGSMTKKKIGKFAKEGLPSCESVECNPTRKPFHGPNGCL